MSRNERRIRKALEKRGYVVEQIEWRPIEWTLEMGGWFVLISPTAIVDGNPVVTVGMYNVEDTLKEIARLPQVP